MTHYTLAGILSPLSVTTDLQATTKEEALTALTDLLARGGRIIDKAAVLTKLQEREALSSTAIEGGIALPHTKSSGVNGVCMAFAISRAGIDCGASDGKPTQLFALAVAPATPDSAYLTTLVELIDKLRLGSIRRKLLDCKTPEELFERLLRYDHAMASIAGIAGSAEA